MDPWVILAWARGLERLAIVGLSGVSLVLGWDLFRRGILDTQTADLKAHSWSIRLQRVGPGIFFALFGTAAFVSAIAHPLELSTDKKTEVQLNTNGSAVSTSTESQKLSEAVAPNVSSDRDAVTAINTFHSIVLPKTLGQVDASHAAAINKADQTLDSYKRSLMFQEFGQMSIQFYSIRDQVPVRPSILGAQSPEFQRTYPKMEEWDRDTFLRSR